MRFQQILSIAGSPRLYANRVGTFSTTRVRRVKGFDYRRESLSGFTPLRSYSSPFPLSPLNGNFSWELLHSRRCTLTLAVFCATGSPVEFEKALLGGLPTTSPTRLSRRPTTASMLLWPGLVHTLCGRVWALPFSFLATFVRCGTFCRARVKPTVGGGRSILFAPEILTLSLALVTPRPSSGPARPSSRRRLGPSDSTR